MARKAILGGAGDTATAVLPRPGVSGTRGLHRVLENERTLAYILLAPTALILGLFIAYPFLRGVWLSVTSATVGDPGAFVGLRNFDKAWSDTIFHRATINTFLYTGVTTVFKLALGMWLAVLLNREFRAKRFARAMFEGLRDFLEAERKRQAGGPK